MVFTGAIVIGAAQFLIGLNKYCNPPQTPPVVDPFGNETADFRAIMRGMVAAAEYGGRLSATQVEIIRSILGRIFAKDYDPENIVDACRALWGYGEEVATYLFNAHPRLTLEFRRNIVRASANVINSGYPPDKEQRGFLLMIYRALQLPEAEFVNDIEF